MGAVSSAGHRHHGIHMDSTSQHHKARLPREQLIQHVASTAGYLVGDEALDVARLTGIGLHSPRHGLREDGDISPEGVDRARALGYYVNVFIDLSRLSWLDQCRIAWARVSGHYYCDCVGGRP